MSSQVGIGIKRFLANLHQKIDSDDRQLINKTVFLGLYFAATQNGLLLAGLFPEITLYRASYNDSEEFYEAILEPGYPAVYKQILQSAYSHAPGSACCRVIRKGEPVYECGDCAVDEMKIICVECFNEEEHEDHDVLRYFAFGDDEGICDCGDSTAFRPMDCLCQKEDAEVKESLEISLMDQWLRETIQVCLDYILDVTNFSVQRIPLIYNNINKNSKLTSQTLSDLSLKGYEKYVQSIDRESTDSWYLILWNDLYESIEKATAAIVNATDVTEHNMEQLMNALLVTEGRYVIKEANDFQSLLESQEQAHSGGLVTTIMNRKDYRRELVTFEVLHWLFEVSQSVNNQLRAMTKKILAEQLLSSDSRFLNEIPVGFFTESKTLLFENGLTHNGNLISGIPRTIHLDSDQALLSLDTNPELPYNSRMQLLLTFSVRFPIPERMVLERVLIPPVVAKPNTKATFARQYMEIYPNFMAVLAIDKNRDPDYGSDISGQIFTDSEIIQDLLATDKLGYILGPLARSTLQYFAADRNLQHSQASKTAIDRGIRDLLYFTKEKLASTERCKLLTRDNFTMLVIFLRNVEQLWLLQRNNNQTKEYEYHFLFASTILNIARNVASALEDVEASKEACLILLNYLLEREIDLDFRVSEDAVSFVNCLNSMLSFFIQNLGFKELSPVLQNLKWPFARISAISLRSIVLESQIKVGFWSNNKPLERRQASVYLDTFMFDLGFARDFHLNQIAAIIDDPKATLFQFLKVWELDGWYLGETRHDKTVYGDKFALISARFITFLYNLFTNRSSFGKSGSGNEANRVRIGLRVALAGGPKLDIELHRCLSSKFSALEEFNDILHDIADYEAESGKYRLKIEQAELADPLNLYTDWSQFEEVSQSLIQYIAKGRGIAEDDVCLSPRIEECGSELVSRNLGRFTKTSEFVRMLSMFLEVAVETNDSTYVPHLLHLIHAIWDDGMLHSNTETIAGIRRYLRVIGRRKDWIGARAAYLDTTML